MSYKPRIPVADSYVAALGHAAYNFAYLEWGIVWLGETIQPGFIGKVRSLTAGLIASQFDVLVDAIPNDPAHLRLKALATSFIALVVERNRLMHGTPFTAEGGEQRLLYRGRSDRRDWSTEGIIEAARSFEKAAIEAGDLLYGGRLQAYERATGRCLLPHS
jgi:hypothetical protein